MKALVYLEGTNKGADFLKKYEGQEINIESLYKNIDINSPPLANFQTSDDKTHEIQLIDIRFIDEFIFIHCFIVDQNGDGVKALLRLKPKNN